MEITNPQSKQAKEYYIGGILIHKCNLNETLN